MLGLSVYALFLPVLFGAILTEGASIPISQSSLHDNEVINVIDSILIGIIDSFSKIAGNSSVRTKDADTVSI